MPWKWMSKLSLYFPPIIYNVLWVNMFLLDLKNKIWMAVMRFPHLVVKCFVTFCSYPLKINVKLPFTFLRICDI